MQLSHSYPLKPKHIIHYFIETGKNTSVNSLHPINHTHLRVRVRERLKRPRRPIPSSVGGIPKQPQDARIASDINALDGVSS